MNPSPSRLPSASTTTAPTRKRGPGSACWESATACRSHRTVGRTRCLSRWSAHRSGPSHQGCGVNRRSRRLLVTTNTELKRHRRAGDHRVEQPGGGQRQRRHVVGERPEQVALDGARGCAGTAGSRRPRRAGRRGPGSGRAASIATSVPVPMASPRSAWASAAASLTPSPTIATTRPSACSRLTHVDLVGRQHLGDHLVDADLGGDRRGRAVLSPVSSTGRQAEPAQPRRPPRRWSA